MSTSFDNSPHDQAAPMQSRAEEVLTDDPLNPEQFIDGRQNVKEALGFIKDWVTAVVAI